MTDNRTKGIGLVLITGLVCGCYSPPKYIAVGRPEVKVVDYTDASRRHLVPSKTHFYRNDTVAICVNGFAGRTVTIQLWERQRGLVRTWTQAIRAPRGVTRSAGLYRDDLGFVRSLPAGTMQVEEDFVLLLERAVPGNYDVRVTSNEGIQQQTSFSVAN